MPNANKKPGDSAQDESYEGAIVLDPKPGFYFESPVGVADFASLYPSTIESENISHDSLVWVKDFDTNGDGTLSVIELYDAAVKYGEAIDGEWSLDRIKEALDRFDANGDKKLDLQEFKMALSQLEDKKRSKFKKAGAAVLDKAGTKGNTKLKKALKRSFTWKKDVASVADAAMDAAEEAEAMLAAGIPDTTLTKPRAFYWVVDKIDSNHVGHSQPYRECEKNLYLT
jgi:DNA polymerase elongation subunit (family B)